MNWGRARTQWNPRRWTRTCIKFSLSSTWMVQVASGEEGELIDHDATCAPGLAVGETEGGSRGNFRSYRRCSPGNQVSQQSRDNLYMVSPFAFWCSLVNFRFDADSISGCMCEFLVVPCECVVCGGGWNLPISKFPDVRDRVQFDLFLLRVCSWIFMTKPLIAVIPTWPSWAWNGLEDSLLPWDPLDVPHVGSSDFPQLLPLSDLASFPSPTLFFPCWRQYCGRSTSPLHKLLSN